MRQAEPAQRAPDRRDVTGVDPALGQFPLDLDQGDPALGARQLAQ
jgi:hypothetical protein